MSCHKYESWFKKGVRIATLQKEAPVFPCSEWEMQTPKKSLFSYSAGVVLDTSECKPNMMNTIFRADEKYFKINTQS